MASWGVPTRVHDNIRVKVVSKSYHKTQLSLSSEKFLSLEPRCFLCILFCNKRLGLCINSFIFNFTHW